MTFPPFQYRTIHLMYVMALLGAALAVFGPWGWLPALVVLSFWMRVFRVWNVIATGCAVMILMGLLLLFLLLPPMSIASEAARRTVCVNNLKQIALALHNYHDTYKSFPPAVIPDEEGRPMHSWRVLILPFLEAEDTYAKYRFDEPWDGPNNSQLLQSIPWGYVCPTHDSDDFSTNYSAVIGPGTAWPREGSHTFRDFRDGTSNTILVLEGPAHQVPWMMPEDLSYEEAIQLLTSPSTGIDDGHRADEGFFFHSSTRRHAALGDGSVRRLNAQLDPEYTAAILQINDGTDLDSLEWKNETQRRLPWSNIFRLAFLILIVILPTPWAIRRRRAESGKPGGEFLRGNDGEPYPPQQPPERLP